MGVAAGYLVLGWFLNLRDGEVWMNRLVGLSSVAFVAVQFCRALRERRLGVQSAPYSPRAWHGVGLGAFAGLASTLAHAGGPVINLFLLPQKLEKEVFVGTVIKYFFIGNVVKLIPYFQQGLMTRQAAVVGLLLLPCVVLGTLSGVYLNRRFSGRSFRIVVYSLAFCIGLYLLSGWEVRPPRKSPAQGQTAAAGGQDAVSAFHSGLNAYEQRDYDSAAAAFGIAAAQPWPCQDRARFNMALAFYQAGHCGEADRALQPLNGSADKTVLLQVPFDQGNCAYRLGRFSRAADLYLLTVRQCRAELAHSKAKEGDERAALLPELLKRAEHNLALARARSEGPAKAEHRTNASSSAQEGSGSGSDAWEASSEGEAAPGQPNPAEQATGNASGSEAGTKSVEAVLSNVTSRDTGPVLRAGPVRTAPPAQSW
jgi:tetratricopeptide (TPR) repeat protein